MTSLQQRPYIVLVELCLAWKLVLLLIALLNPGSDYDTSTLLALDQTKVTSSSSPHYGETSVFLRSIQKLVRWDAIYFVNIADRGYLYEQEWAFGWGYTTLVSSMSRAFVSNPTRAARAVTAVLISNIAHVISVLLLYRLTTQLHSGLQTRVAALVPACLHIIAPAGLFLCSPYGESLFSFLQFAGASLYSDGHLRSGAASELSIVASGLLFGLASTVRSNGIFSGVMFACDLGLMVFVDRRVLVRRAFALLLGGALIAVGFALPQVIAYIDICRGVVLNQDMRPWCKVLVPSIYTFVQKQYWNVGFLRYWTLSNLPLFIISAPALSLLLVSGFRYVRLGLGSSLSASSKKQVHGTSSTQRDNSNEQVKKTRHCLAILSVPQVLLAALALTNFHIQIITRIATGYPIPYFWIASLLASDSRLQVYGWEINASRTVLQWMVMYGIVQGVLYASFLPPA